MGYSPCKMVSLGQKLKIPKRWENRYYDHIKLVVCKKPLQKTPNIRKNDSILKMAKIVLNAWAIPMQNGQFGSKIKNAKKVQQTIVRLH